jgi:hypothetical protein
MGPIGKGHLAFPSARTSLETVIHVLKEVVMNPRTIPSGKSAARAVALPADRFRFALGVGVAVIGAAIAVSNLARLLA